MLQTISACGVIAGMSGRKLKLRSDQSHTRNYRGFPAAPAEGKITLQASPAPAGLLLFAFKK
ncbi:MAG: hypothetical protein JWP12_1038 [Bacteroidetes bacterium]|nr:hypothetical protein [Bacteroidota bacterium]